jgi:hypothetical protein
LCPDDFFEFIDHLLIPSSAAFDNGIYVNVRVFRDVYVLVVVFFVLQQAYALEFIKQDFIVVQTGNNVEFVKYLGIL